MKAKTKTTEIQKTSMATINEGYTILTTCENTTTGNKDNQSLIEGQIELLKLGLTFTPAQKIDLNTMEFAFIHKLLLIYHFTDINENEINPDQSFLKRNSTGTPFTKNKELKNLIRNLSNISFYNTHKQDNIINLRKDLNDFLSLTTSTKIIIKEAEKQG